MDPGLAMTSRRRRRRALRAGSVGLTCGLLVIAAPAAAKMPCPMGQDGSGGSMTAGEGPPGSDRSASSGPLAPMSMPSGTTTTPSRGSTPTSRQPVQPAAATVPAQTPATVTVPTATQVPVATTVPSVSAQDVARAARAERAARRAQARERAAARRAVQAEVRLVALRLRTAGRERWQAPAAGSAWVDPPQAVAARSDARQVLPLLALLLLGFGGVAGVVAMLRRRGRQPAPTAPLELDLVEAELQEILAEEHAARELRGPFVESSR